MWSRGGNPSMLFSAYNYKTDNHYAIDGAGDIRLYRIEILRHGQKKLDVKVYEHNGKDELILKTEKTVSPDFETWFTISDAFPKQDLAIKSNGAPGTVIDFNVASKNSLEFAKGDFIWKSDDKGIVGPYCEVGDVNQVGSDYQFINCDVPVLA
ncbi:hypothetical protein P280DRAFT_526128 [Massarina eburnea CBS 473.64]|uniref:Uncharacterized protein n=1 Tax=Massarina eburnea CBS 473.64 TaxID=1395130 RepID=A0A6A6RYZ0_9PLEO|nr:hypothetical protein P280DRAFT_526128 [Massarina eburnea CBS 473.64]